MSNIARNAETCPARAGAHGSGGRDRDQKGRRIARNQVATIHSSVHGIVHEGVYATASKVADMDEGRQALLPARSMSHPMNIRRIPWPAP
jgi:hypothetical protein